MNTILTLLLFILILGITVFVHELGHFLFAKIVGVHVYEFSLGFGPVIFKHIAKDKTQYSIRCFPLGGFVSLAGEEQDVDLTKHKGHNLQDKNVFQRFLVMVMGVGFNFIFAFLMLFMIGSFYTARDLTPVLNEVNYNSPAAKAGLEKGDKVLEINNHKIKYFDDIFVYLTIEDLSKSVSFKVEKQDKSIVTYIINPEKIKQDDGTEKYFIGVSTLASKAKPGLASAFKYSIDQEGAYFKQMFIVLKGLFTGNIPVNSLSGPVGIYSIVGQVRSQGLASIMSLIALLCINVGVINLLPFPAFDGGRILFLIIEKLKGSPVSPKVENTIHSICFILLMVLMIYITFNDILKLF